MFLCVMLAPPSFCKPDRPVLSHVSLCRDLRPKSLTGSKMEKICDKVHITLNKNAVQVSLPVLTIVVGGFKQYLSVAHARAEVSEVLLADVGMPRSEWPKRLGRLARSSARSGNRLCLGPRPGFHGLF